jgi:hypothetical protein
LLIRESGSLAVFADVRRFFIPPILAQNDFLLLAALLPAFNLDGLVVTAVCNFEPGFSLRYEATPLAFNPPEGFLPSLRCHAATSNSSSSEIDSRSSQINSESTLFSFAMSSITSSIRSNIS